MGDNEVRLVEGYLKLLDELQIAKKTGDTQKAEVANAKIEGIVFCYETYECTKFQNLLDRWSRYTDIE